MDRQILSQFFTSSGFKLTATWTNESSPRRHFSQLVLVSVDQKAGAVSGRLESLSTSYSTWSKPVGPRIWVGFSPNHLGTEKKPRKKYFYPRWTRRFNFGFGYWWWTSFPWTYFKLCYSNVVSPIFFQNFFQGSAILNSIKQRNSLWWIPTKWKRFQLIAQ